MQQRFTNLHYFRLILRKYNYLPFKQHTLKQTHNMLNCQSLEQISNRKLRQSKEFLILFHHCDLHRFLILGSNGLKNYFDVIILHGVGVECKQHGEKEIYKCLVRYCPVGCMLLAINELILHQPFFVSWRIIILVQQICVAVKIGLRYLEVWIFLIYFRV